MTVKAGQKCTAVRRVLVPRALQGDVAEAIAARLTKVTVGDPRSRTSARAHWSRSTSARGFARPSSRCTPRPTSCSATPTVLDATTGMDDLAARFRRLPAGQRQPIDRRVG